MYLSLHISPREPITTLPLGICPLMRPTTAPGPPFHIMAGPRSRLPLSRPLAVPSPSPIYVVVHQHLHVCVFHPVPFKGAISQLISVDRVQPRRRRAMAQSGSSKSQPIEEDIPLKIRRVTKACDLCRKRKARCDGDPASSKGVSATSTDRSNCLKICFN
jgi:hypothetical protein